MDSKHSDTVLAELSTSKAYLHTTQAAVEIYVKQAVWLILFLMPVTIYLFYWLWDWDFINALIIAWISGLIYFVLRLRTWGKVATRDSQRVGDKEPDEKPARYMVHVRHDRVKENGHFQQDEYDLPGSPEALQVLARGVLGGRPFTEAVWAGKNRPFSLPEFRELRRLGLGKYGLFEYVNPKAPQQGIQLTQKGRELFEELADGDVEEFVDD